MLNNLDNKTSTKYLEQIVVVPFGTVQRYL
jgi:hypothetical protein